MSRSALSAGAGVALALFTLVTMPACLKKSNDNAALKDGSTAPAPAVEADPVVTAAAFAALQKHCATCHAPGITDSDGGGPGGISYIMDVEKMVQKKKIIREPEANRKKSRLLARLRAEEDGMPPAKDFAGNDLPRMTEDEIVAIEKWVESGAPAAATP